MTDELNIQDQPQVEYTDDNIRKLSDVEHIRTRPGMYIGRLGDGTHAEDGIYVLLKEAIDNSIDEFRMNAGKRIEVDVFGKDSPITLLGEGKPSETQGAIAIRDYGRGIPQGKMIEAVSQLNTGGKYDSKAFKKSVGMNGVGVKAVNFLSTRFEVRSFRDGIMRRAYFERGILKEDETLPTEEENGTFIFFEPDNTLFTNYRFQDDIVAEMLRNYTIPY